MAVRRGRQPPCSVPGPAQALTVDKDLGAVADLVHLDGGVADRGRGGAKERKAVVLAERLGGAGGCHGHLFAGQRVQGVKQGHRPCQGKVCCKKGGSGRLLGRRRGARLHILAKNLSHRTGRRRRGGGGGRIKGEKRQQTHIFLPVQGCLSSPRSTPRSVPHLAPFHITLPPVPFYHVPCLVPQARLCTCPGPRSQSRADHPRSAGCRNRTR